MTEEKVTCLTKVCNFVGLESKNSINIDISNELWNDLPNKNSYSSEEQFREHTLEQYKMYVEMADRISLRRDKANAFFLTLNGLILSAAAALIDKGYQSDPKWGLLFPLFVLLLQCFFWWRLIFSYKQLNGAKFHIIGEFERLLPASPYRKAEWECLLAKGQLRSVYWPLSHLESKIPVMFAISYLAAAGALLFAK